MRRRTASPFRSPVSKQWKTWGWLRTRRKYPARAEPATDTEQRRRAYASVAAHELAHQWFGDLVTLAWWDDTWLNEAFATWTSSKILAEWKPEWKSRLSDLSAKFGAMSEDGLVTTRKIRQEILTKDDISNAF